MAQLIHFKVSQNQNLEVGSVTFLYGGFFLGKSMFLYHGAISRIPFFMVIKLRSLFS